MVDAHAASGGGDRSSWIGSLVIPALREAGKLDEVPAQSKAASRLAELLREFPEEQVLGKLEELAKEAAALAAGDRA